MLRLLTHKTVRAVVKEVFKDVDEDYDFWPAEADLRAPLTPNPRLLKLF